MWAVYINLYNDKLDDFSLVNTYPLVCGEKVPTLIFWRLIAGLEKFIMKYLNQIILILN